MPTLQYTSIAAENGSFIDDLPIFLKDHASQCWFTRGLIVQSIPSGKHDFVRIGTYLGMETITFTPPSNLTWQWNASCVDRSRFYQWLIFHVVVSNYQSCFNRSQHIGMGLVIVIPSVIKHGLRSEWWMFQVR